MFRRLPTNLPQDPIIEPDLDKLGYFINENDQFRQKANPDQKYQFRVNRSDRVNDMLKVAMNTCSRKIVLDRLAELGVRTLRLPPGTPQNEKHLPILVSDNMAEKKHVVVIFPERNTDLGILSYRVMGDEGINVGSIVNLVKGILAGPIDPSTSEVDNEMSTVANREPRSDAPGIIIANPAQLIWYRGGGRVVTYNEWLNLPRKSPIYGPMRVDEDKNRIDGNKDFMQHVQYIFKHILQKHGGEPQMCHPQAKISIIGLEYVGSEALQCIVHNWQTWKDRVNCIALINPQHSLVELFDDAEPSVLRDREEIEDFIARRARAYKLSQRPLEALITGRDRLGCNVYAAGETLYDECCLVRCWGSVLDFFQMCRTSEIYAEPYLVLENPDEEDKSPKMRTYKRRILNEEEAEKAGYHYLQIAENSEAEAS